MGVLSTGSELVPANHKEMISGKIRDSNRPMLLAMMKQSHFDTIDLGESLVLVLLVYRYSMG